MRILNLLAIASLLIGCAEGVPDGTPETSTVNLTDGPGDAIEQLRVRADGMTVWAEPIVLAENDWLFQGRTSHSIDRIYATIGNEDARATAISARKFEVRLTARQMENNLGEQPLIVHIDTTSGREFEIMMGARARFIDTSGSSKIYPWKNIEPIMIGRQRVFRGRVTTPADVTHVAGWNDDDSEPIATQEDATHWTLDWYPGMLAWAAHPTEDVVNLVADSTDGDRYRRSAPIHMQVVTLGVTNQSAAQAWPTPLCTDAVRACVAPHDAETADFESCGSAAEVSPCLDEVSVDDTADWLGRFANDFRRQIIDHYSVNEADIVAAGGNTRSQALLSVDTADMEEVTNADEVPSGHDLQDYRAFTHPDVTFPGSDIVWFGIYDRATGDLVEIYDFN